MHSWRVLLLPYLEQSDLFKQYDFKEPWDGPNNRKLADKMPKVYALHAKPSLGNVTTNFLAVVGPNTAWPPGRRIGYKDVVDGTGQTILIVENDGAGVHWMEPRDLRLAEMSFVVN